MIEETELEKVILNQNAAMTGAITVRNPVRLKSLLELAKPRPVLLITY